MKRHVFCPAVRGILLLAAVCGLINSSQAQVKPVSAASRDAIKARTEAVLVQKEVLATITNQLRGVEKAVKTAQAIRDLIVDADHKLKAGDTVLDGQRYKDAMKLYKDSSKLYRAILDGYKIQKEVAETEQRVAAARKLAEESAKPDQLQDGIRLQMNAEGYLQARKFDIALVEYGKAQKAFEKFASGKRAAIVRKNIAALENAVANGDKFGAEDILAELESLIPKDPRMPALRSKVAALPQPKMDRSRIVDIGGGVKMEFVLMQSGNFVMGSEKGHKNERPMHKVTIRKPFYLAKYETTQEQWQAVMDSNPSSFKGVKNPVENVSWEDCQAFLRKLGEKALGQTFRLPTEAEWEYACRASSATEYCYGDADGRLGEYAWYDSNSDKRTHPVGEKKPNAWGLYDMHGNVWEWCADWRGDYDSGVIADPVGASSGSGRVLRGGSWNFNAAACRSACRIGYDPLRRFNCYGLRVVMVAR